MTFGASQEAWNFEGAILARAIGATFARRATPLPQQTPRGLTEEFSEDPTKQALWTAFVRKGRLDVESKTLSQVVIELGAFLCRQRSLPVLESLSEKCGAKGNGNNGESDGAAKTFPGSLDFSHRPFRTSMHR
jgi:hypothetical protein